MHGQIPQQDRRLGILVFAASTACLLPGAFWGLPTGKAVAGALRVVDGQVPYRDFWSMYAPGQFYAIAGLFWIFGREILVQAVAAVLVRAASAAVFFLLLRRTGSPRGLSLLLAGLFAGMFWATGPELTTYPPALLFLLLALDRVTSYLQGDGAGRLYWAGCWVGLAAVFKHDVAAYFAAGIGASLFLAWLRAGDQRPALWITPGAAVLRFGASALVALLPCLAWLTWSAGVEAWQDLLVFPATTFVQLKNEGDPGLFPPLGLLVGWLRDPTNLRVGHTAVFGISTWVLLNLPQYIFAGAVWVVASRPRLLDATAAATAILWLSCMPLFWMASRVDTNTHVYSMAVLSFPLWAMAWQLSARSNRCRRLLRPVLGTLMVVYAIGVLIPPATQVFRVLIEWSGSSVLDLPGVRGVRLGAREHAYYDPIARFFREHTREDERIYVGLLRHDAIVISKPNLYAVTGRASCCRYSELHPAVADRIAAHREIIADLEHHDVRGIILWKFGWSNDVLDEFKARSIAAVADGGSTMLDEYIAERFEPIAQYDEYIVMWRKDLPKPIEPRPPTAR